MSDRRDTPDPAGANPYDHQAVEQPPPTQQVPAPPAGQPGQPDQSPYGHHPGFPGQPVAGQPVPGQPVPGQPVPGQPVAGQGYPPGYGPPPGFATTAESSGTKVGAGLLWSLAAVVAIAVAVSIKEDGQNGWERIGVWAGFAIVAALATGAPALRSNLNLDAEKAWKIAAAGAVGLAAFWVLFILPSIEQNVSFLATLGCVAGGLAAWTAPGRPDAGPDDRGQTW